MPSPPAPPMQTARMSFRAQCTQQLLDLVARQAVVGVEAGPAGVRCGLRAQVVGGRAADVRRNSPLILSMSSPSPGSPSQPAQASTNGPSGALPAALQFGLNAKRRPHGQRAVAMRLLVDAQQLARDAMALEDAGGADGVIGAGRFRAARAPGRRAKSAPRSRNQISSAIGWKSCSMKTPVGSPLPSFSMVSAWHRRGRVARDAGALERLGVGAGDERKRAAPEAPDRADVDRVVRRRLRRAPAASASASRRGCPARRNNTADRRSAW